MTRFSRSTRISYVRLNSYAPPLRTSITQQNGITFFDNCWEYNRGKSENWMGKGLKGRRDRVFLMTKVCTHGRDASLATQMLEESLRRLQTDHLDLWQIHRRSGSVVALWPLMVDSSITRFQCNSTILRPGWLTGFRSTRWNAALNRWTECHAALPSQVLKWPLLSTEAVRSGGQRPAAAVEPTD